MAAAKNRKQGASKSPAQGRTRTRCTQAIANEITCRLALGETLTGICRDKHLPPPSTVLGWAQSETLIEPDGSGDPVNPTSIDVACESAQEALASVLAAGDSTAQEGLPAPANALKGSQEGMGDSRSDKVGQGEVGSTLLFRVYYAHARVLGYEVLADTVRDIADDGSNDYYETESGHRKVDHENINRSRLRVETYKWLLARALPKVYSEHGVKLTVSGGADGHSPDVVLTGNDVDL